MNRFGTCCTPCWYSWRFCTSLHVDSCTVCSIRCTSIVGIMSGHQGLRGVCSYVLFLPYPHIPLYHNLYTTKHQVAALLPLAGACWSSPDPSGGRCVVLGAAGLFDDAWLDKEDNSKISDFVFKWLRPVSQQSSPWLRYNIGQPVLLLSS